MLLNKDLLVDQETYLSNMSKPVSEKLKIVKYFPKNARHILDVGCADGSITAHFAQLFPWVKFHAVDLNEEFINLAKQKFGQIKNISFERVYLRDLLSRDKRYDAVVFCSVLHEFYTYGQGISSVLKALADAHELLINKGRIFIRDMILHKFTKHADLASIELVNKIKANHKLTQQIDDFEKLYGKLTNEYNINHFLLKYMYDDNWERELLENYTAVTFEEYEKAFELLGMRTQYKESYLIEYLRNKWRTDFGLSEEELDLFRSTGILVAEKI